ncbi:adhesion G-protein coupled receptor G1 [Elgaria multicarinata webbii]|uniref:adhesion G-protein coupled receptor G1 n=1 Tax=Elgaria multicarinata webbii TaxID=159646 RepID=UPI002FCD53BA
MLFFLLPLILGPQGICGDHRHEVDFSFCAHRKQTEKGHLHYKIWDQAISIVNSATGLNISAPFPPAHQSSIWTLPDRAGSYRFCVYWFQDDHIFMLNYGNTKNYTLSKQANYSFFSPNITGKTNKRDTHWLHNVSYTFAKGFHNQSLPNSSSYEFFLTDSGKQRTSLQVSEAEKEFRSTEEKLKSLETEMRTPRQGRTKRGNPFVHLKRLESTLGKVDFEGKNKSFGEGALLQASVWNVPSQSPHDLPIKLRLEEDKELRGFEVTLPKIVFADPSKSQYERRSGMTRAVLMAVTSQTLFQKRDSSQILGGKVIGISVRNRSVHGLPQDQRVAITFQHNRLPGNMTPQCVFWDMDAEAGHSGEWNESGCEVVRGKTHLTCLCDHLTFFAVLMVSSPDVDPVHHHYLTVVTYVGCIISALASFLTIFFFLCSRKKQRDHIVYVHMNLLWAIFILDMSFLIAVPLAPSGGDASCKAGAMFLHFGVLACLTWMGIEGYSLYQLVIEVFHSYVKHLLLKLCLVGWGFPMFVVTLIFVVDQSHYGPVSFKVYESPERYTNATICWITKKEINNYLNLGFLSLVLFFNSIILAAMVREILKLRYREKHWEYAVMLLGLSCVLGIPWGLIFFSFTSGTFKLVAVYLFTIINSLQGFLIFLWYLAKVLQSHKKESMQFASSNSMRLPSSSTSI